MSFFENQDSARKRAKWLIVAYILAVIILVAAVNAVIFAPLAYYTDSGIMELFSERTFLAVSVSAITLLIIGSGSSYKISKISKKETYTASLFGGRYVDPSTENFKERVLFNVIEEISIASGVPLPFVYLLDNEESINAFSMGSYPGICVIGVTRGCLKHLNRDELQSVIAHEFSHIANGDTRLDCMLLGLLHGILVVALVGYFLVLGRTRSGKAIYLGNRRNRPPLHFLPLGIALMVVGYLGVFLAKIIKKAIMRQQEYLADAQAVQFTRNPEALTSVFRKLMSRFPGSYINNLYAHEANHMFLAECLPRRLKGSFGMHPSLENRIKRVGISSGDSSEEKKTLRDKNKRGSKEEGEKPESRINAEKLAASVGTIEAAGLNYARSMFEIIPNYVLNNVHEISGAESIIYVMLFSASSDIKKKQLKHIKENVDLKIFNNVKKLDYDAVSLPSRFRLPLIDISVATLKGMDRDNYIRFSENIRFLIRANKKISLFEYAVYSMIKRHLKPAFAKTKKTAVRYKNIKPLIPQCRILLSSLAHYGEENQKNKEKSYKSAFEKLGVDNYPEMFPEKKRGFKEIDKALKELDEAVPQVKKNIIKAAAVCVSADGWITVSQSELLRVIADAIGCPVPPLFPGIVRE